MKIRYTCAAFAAALMLQSVPVSANTYDDSEVALSLRPVSVEAESGVYCSDADDNTIYVMPEAAAKGFRAHYSVFLESEISKFCIIELKLRSENPAITFDAETFRNPKTDFGETETYTLPDGTTYTSNLKPYCLGKLSGEKYSAECFALTANFDAEENTFNLLWQHGMNNSDSFLGGKSDAFSFVDLDVQAAPGLEPGTHDIVFVSDPVPGDPLSYSDTYISADTSDGGPSSYDDALPVMKHARIIVGQRGDVNHDGAVNASDAAIILTYAAADGAGGTPTLTGQTGVGEDFTKELADVDRKAGEAIRLNASDAAYILMYAAASGSGNEASWDDIVKN